MKRVTIATRPHTDIDAHINASGQVIAVGEYSHGRVPIAPIISLDGAMIALAEEILRRGA